ncbi:MAG: SDR family oxidoreductase [Azoarcus sp.]|nr:SDR family oxidoreductase [Azoarcus sp.]
MRAIVTGHSRGLGAAIAVTLLKRGIRVLGLARHGNADLADRFPALFQEEVLDLSDLVALDAWLSGGRLKHFLADKGSALLINNAGLLQPVGLLGNQSTSRVLQAVSLNVAAPLALANAFAAGGSPERTRRIVHISSGAARKPYAGWSVYCASKAALDHHARAVALEAPAWLKVSSIAPGVIDTDMQGEIRATSEAAFPQRARFEALKRDGQLNSAEQCALQLVNHVLSDAFGHAAVSDLRELD